MYPVLAVTFFCEDIREEKSGLSTLIGVMPNNINTTDFPAVFPKIGLYTRINFSPDDEVGDISIWYHVSGAEKTLLTRIDSALVLKAKSEAKRGGVPMAGLISKSLLPAFTIMKAAVVTAIVQVGDREIITGGINVDKVPAVS